jgi:two-component system response regulator CpxR
MAHILIADDDLELAELLVDYLALEGFTVDTARDGGEAVDKALKTQYDLIVLDIMMPVMDGLDALRQLRTRSTTPVLMLTARGDDIDRIIGLEIGADDYLTKPCNPRELLARIRAILRRASGAALTEVKHSPLEFGELKLDPRYREARVRNEAVGLTVTEFEILRTLAERAGDVVDKQFLSEHVLERKLTQHDRAIDMHISHIRKKLEKFLSGTETIRTVRGVGFTFVLTDDLTE